MNVDIIMRGRQSGIVNSSTSSYVCSSVQSDPPIIFMLDSDVETMLRTGDRDGGDGVVCPSFYAISME